MIRTHLVTAMLLLGTFGLAVTAPDMPDQTEPDLQPDNIENIPGTLIVDLQDGSSERDLEKIEQLLHADFDWTHPEAKDEALAVGEVDNLRDAVSLLKGHPLVEAAEPQGILHTMEYPNDPLYHKQWHLPAMGAPYGWENTPAGKGVIVAVIDTGVAKVEDLDESRILEGMDFTGTGDWFDDNGHGTHCAGTIAQTTNNGVGVAGVAPNAQILPVKVLSRYGSGTFDDVAAGVDWAADNGADVISMSLGGPHSKVLEIAIQKATAKGVIVVAARGNGGSTHPDYPGALEETIGVSALGPNGELAPYSSYGKGTDIAAPGGDKTQGGDDGGVWQNTLLGGDWDSADYHSFQGTSMATPHVAGAAAVLLSTGNCDSKCVQEVLLDSADGDGWTEKYGYGKLNLTAAVNSIDTNRGALKFFLAGLFAYLIVLLAPFSRGRQMMTVVASAITANGIFFLDKLPFVPNNVFVEMASSGVLAWPDLVFGHNWSSFPLWASAVIPLALTIVLGPFRELRPYVLGFCIGIGTSLLYGALWSTMSVWWLGSFLGTGWLILNGVFCIILGMVLAGTEKLEVER